MRCPPPVFAVQRPAQVKAELPQLKKPRKAARSPEYGDPAGRPGANQVSLSCRVSRGTTAVGVGGPEVSAVGPAQEPADVDPEDTCHVRHRVPGVIGPHREAQPAGLDTHRGDAAPELDGDLLVGMVLLQPFPEALLLRPGPPAALGNAEFPGPCVQSGDREAEVVGQFPVVPVGLVASLQERGLVLVRWLFMFRHSRLTDTGDATTGDATRVSDLFSRHGLDWCLSRTFPAHCESPAPGQPNDAPVSGAAGEPAETRRGMTEPVLTEGRPGDPRRRHSGGAIREVARSTPAGAGSARPASLGDMTATPQASTHREIPGAAFESALPAAPGEGHQMQEEHE